MPARRGYYRAEPFDIYPFLGVGFGYTNNLLGQSTDQVSSSLLVISPRVQAETRSGAHVHSIRYGGSYGVYPNSRDDDFAVHEVVFGTVNQFTARTDLSASAYWLQQQDPRGVSTNRPFGTSPDRWRGLGATMLAGYGARSAQGRIEGELSVTDKQYQNNRDLTAALDVSTVSLAGRFLYRIGPRTRLLTEVRRTEFSYDTGPYDNTEDRLLAGVTWDLSVTTFGTIKAGVVRKQFDNPAANDYSAFAFDAAMRWVPRTYSFVDLAVSRTPSDSTGTGFFTVDTWTAATWNHRWAGYLSSRVLLARLGQEFQGLGRDDTNYQVGVAGFFDVRSWLRLGAEYSHQTRNSNQSAFEYSRDQILFTVGVTL